MNLRHKLTAAALALSLAAAPALTTPAAAQDLDATVSVGDLLISAPTARINIGDRPSAGYLSIDNKGGDADRLIGASSPAYGRIELHTHEMNDGVMQMREVEGIDAAAGETIALEPGGLHLMMFEPGDLPESLEIPVTLTFEKAGDVNLFLIGEKIGAKKSGGHSGHGTGNHN